MRVGLPTVRESCFKNASGGWWPPLPSCKLKWNLIVHVAAGFPTRLIDRTRSLELRVRFLWRYWANQNAVVFLALILYATEIEFDLTADPILIIVAVMPSQYVNIGCVETKLS